VSVFDEPKIDCHLHVLDPARFPYAPDTPYAPTGHEIATAAQMTRMFAAYSVTHALLVQPNSGYGTDNRCILDAIVGGGGRFKGIAVVAHDCGMDRLSRLRAQGIVGVAFNLPFHGADHYRDTAGLIERLAALDMILQIQVQEDQLLALLPLIEASTVRVLVDHCGRPAPGAGLQQAGFQALLRLGRGGRACVKLSGLMKFSRKPHPFTDAWPYVRAVDAFGLDACLWGSDWPFLRAEERVDYGPLLTLAAALFPRESDRRKLFWETPRRVFGFA
jgi:predicted TIM-barrel fold metal-dependent hydrolase